MFKDLVEYMVKTMVDEPSEVEVYETRDSEGVFIEVRVAPDDTGRVIGRKGRVINALRTVVNVLADKEGENVQLEVI